MKILLDTNVLLWSLFEAQKIKGAVRELIGLDETIVVYSQISLIEIQIKVSKGTLRLKRPPTMVPELADVAGFFPRPPDQRRDFQSG